MAEFVKVFSPAEMEHWYGAARYILDSFGFKPYRNGFLQCGKIYAFVDSHESPVGQRYVGFFDLRIHIVSNMQRVQENMHPVALVPWYGDGEALEVARHMVSGIAYLLLHGVDNGQRQAVQATAENSSGERRPGAEQDPGATVPPVGESAGAG